ncbi:hypothetical protein PspLS_07224 [Pyricularia sp. CBS 133598]|nr:hypothetical protein PspLS_07224 [Pyricularia sp. CBS 133598]
MPSVRGILDKLIGKKPVETPPPITTRTAVFLLILYTFVYVVPFYVSSRTRPSAQLSRDAPSVIRARITSVLISCLICSLATFYVVTKDGQITPLGALRMMGYWPVGFVETAQSLALTMLLFLGPLFEYFVVERGWREWIALTPVYELFGEWTMWRNIVAGPVTEEILFRSAGIPLMLLARTSVTKTIFLTPIIFGLAHMNHFYEFRISHPQVPVTAAALRSVFQFCFTTLFGAYATFVFLRGGSLLSVCLIHAFCNSMGLPRLWGRVEPPAAAGEFAGDGQARQPKATGLTVAYYVLLVCGAVLFYQNIFTLTKSPLELAVIQ